MASRSRSAGSDPLDALIVDLLELGGDEDVLEAGFGPGTLVESLAAATGGRVAGVDPSPQMLSRALRRNLDAARAGRVDLRLAPPERLPFADAGFDRVVAVYSSGKWDDLGRAFRELRRVLRPTGFGLVIARKPSAELADALRATGFGEVEIARYALRRRPVTAMRVEPVVRPARPAEG